MMKRSRLPLCIAWTAVLAAALPGTAGGSLAGEQIMEKVNRRFRGLSTRMVLEMTLRDTARQKVFHKSIVMERKKFGASYRSAYWVVAPEHEKRIALLLSEDLSPTGMWMYFPATQRSTEIVTRGFPALASDFSCEDLLEQVPMASFHFRLLGEERQAGHVLARVEMVPASDRLKAELGFARSIGWVRQDIGMIIRADYFDEKDSVFKRFTADEIAKVGGVWTAHRLLMENFRAEHATEVRISGEDHSSSIPQAIFAQEMLGPGFDLVAAKP